MDRIKPEHVTQLPRDRTGGMVWIVAIGIGLAAAMYGGWRIYVNTAIRWDERFNAPLATPREGSETKAIAPKSTPLSEQKLRAIEAARREHESAGKVDKCINGIAFRRLPEGGWENLPGVECR